MSKFYGFDYDTPKEPPHVLHPTAVQLMTNGQLWVWKPLIPFHLPPHQDGRIVISDDYVEQLNGMITLVSKVSIHIAKYQDPNPGACHVIITRDEKRWVAQPLKHQDHSHSYRHELEIFYLALRVADTKLQLPHQITQYMDHKATFKLLETDIYKPGQTLGMDYNIIMSHTKLKDESKHTVTGKWAMGHVREKKKECHEAITAIEDDNSECNADTEDCVRGGVRPKTFDLPQS